MTAIQTTPAECKYIPGRVGGFGQAIIASRLVTFTVSAFVDADGANRRLRDSTHALVRADGKTLKIKLPIPGCAP